jgi:hypothetical protein
MRRFRRNFRKAVKALALSLAATAVFTGTASASLSGMPPGYAPEIEAELALIEAPSFSPITSPAELYAGQLEPRQHLAASYRAYVDRNAGVAKPAGFPQAEVTSAAASSDGVDRGEVALGLGIGLIVATAMAIAVAALRSRLRVVHA